MASRRQIRLPSQWSRHVKSGILHAISLASVALTIARSRATSRRRLRAKLEQAKGEFALLREELLIKDGRWERSRSRRRLHYTPVQRMRILQLRAARLQQSELARRCSNPRFSTRWWTTPKPPFGTRPFLVGKEILAIA